MTEAVKTDTRLTPLDPTDPRTWKNIPCPVDLSAIQAELARVGGVNAQGEPNFIIVWGQEYRTWDCGRMRIHFDEEAVPAIHTPNRFAVPPDVYARSLSWLQKQNEKRAAAYMNLDWDAFNKHADIAEYLAENELSDNYMRLPDDPTEMRNLIALMPDGWMYLNGLHTFEHIGQQCFYVLQWFRPAEFGDRKAWDELRFDKAYLPETDQEEALVDINGPYPVIGQYEGVAIRVCETRIYEDKHPVLVGVTIPREIHGFKEPTFDNTVEPLKELLKIRDRLTDSQKDKVGRNRSRFKDFREKRVEGDAEFRKGFREKFDDAKPVGRGEPTNISANKNKIR